MSRNPEGARWRHAGLVVAQERIALGLSRAAASEPYGPSESTWSKIEGGVAVSPKSAAAISRRLGWPPEALLELARTGVRPARTVDDPTGQLAAVMAAFSRMPERRRRLLLEIAEFLAEE